MSHRPIGLAFLGAFVALQACAPPPAERAGFDAADPAARIHAIRRAGVEGDRSKLGPLVAALDSEDPAVRMMAIQALERITGKRRGYSPYAAPATRSAAIERWRHAIEPAAATRPREARRSGGDD